MLRKLARFGRLSRSERAALARAWALLPAVDLAARLGLSRRLLVAPVAASSGSEGPPPERLQELVAIAARQHLWPMRCLPQALTLVRLLARQGRPARVRLGVRRRGDAFEAHAWVELEGRPLGRSGRIGRGFLPLEEQPVSPGVSGRAR